VLCSTLATFVPARKAAVMQQRVSIIHTSNTHTSRTCSGQHDAALQLAVKTVFARCSSACGCCRASTHTEASETAAALTLIA
jgi:hypothetical protein